jgi:hypothetical protein
MKKEYIALVAILTIVVVFVAVKWQTVKSWFSKKNVTTTTGPVDEPKKDEPVVDPNKKFSDPDDGGAIENCNNDRATRWQYVFYTDTVTAAVAKVLFDKAAVTFNREMNWLGEKHGEVSFMVTSKAAKTVIENAITVANLRYFMKCFV